MPCYVGLDTAKNNTSICVLDQAGSVVKQGVVASEPKAIIQFLRGDGRRYGAVGLEVWCLAPSLAAALKKAGLPVICIEAMHTHALLSAARANKTDRNDALGIAEIMRAGIYKSVYVKSIESRKGKALLTARQALQWRSVDMENTISGILLSFGVKVRSRSAKRFEADARKLIRRDAFLQSAVNPLIRVRNRLREEADALKARIDDAASQDPVCQRLMTVLGVGPLTAYAFRVAIDSPKEFTRSRNVAAHFGLTPRSIQSGTMDRKGPITRRGNSLVRASLHRAAAHQLRANTDLGKWGAQIAARRGRAKATVAVARRLAVILHRMWVTETDFRTTMAA